MTTTRTTEPTQYNSTFMSLVRHALDSDVSPAEEADMVTGALQFAATACLRNGDHEGLIYTLTSAAVFDQMREQYGRLTGYTTDTSDSYEDSDEDDFDLEAAFDSIMRDLAEYESEDSDEDAHAA